MGLTIIGVTIYLVCCGYYLYKVIEFRKEKQDYAEAVAASQQVIENNMNRVREYEITLENCKQEIEYKKRESNKLDGILENKKETLDAKAIELEEAYKQKIADLVASYDIDLNKMQKTHDAAIEILQKDLEREKQIVRAANEARTRAEQEESEKEFYKMQIEDSDIPEIQRLQSLALDLRSPDILFKLVWKEYYQQPLTKLINRVVGSAKTCGIYKITYVPTGKCYIGKSVDIAERWKKHVKCALRADKGSAPLYDEMFKLGVHNFSFEIIEKIPELELAQREAEWIDFYEADINGFNSMKGARK